MFFSGIQPSAETQAAFMRIPDIMRDLRHGAAGTEHLLLAFLRSAPELFDRRCEPAALEKIVLRLSPPAPATDDEQAGEFPYTPAAVEVLKLAFAEAGRDGGSVLKLDHVILALIDTARGVASAALSEVGIDSRRDWLLDQAE